MKQGYVNWCQFIIEKPPISNHNRLQWSLWNYHATAWYNSIRSHEVLETGLPFSGDGHATAWPKCLAVAWHM